MTTLQQRTSSVGGSELCSFVPRSENEWLGTSVEVPSVAMRWAPWDDSRGDCDGQVVLPPTCVIVYPGFLDEPRTSARSGYGRYCGAGVSIYHVLQNAGWVDFGSVLQVDTRPNWLRIAESTRDELSIEEVTEIVSEINSNLLMRDYDGINLALRSSDVAKMSLDAVVAILRTSFPARTMLPYWETFLNYSDESFCSRGYNGKSIKSIRIASSR